MQPYATDSHQIQPGSVLETRPSEGRKTFSLPLEYLSPTRLFRQFSSLRRTSRRTIFPRSFIEGVHHIEAYQSIASSLDPLSARVKHASFNAVLKHSVLISPRDLQSQCVFHFTPDGSRICTLGHRHHAMRTDEGAVQFRVPHRLVRSTAKSIHIM